MKNQKKHFIDKFYWYEYQNFNQDYWDKVILQFNDSSIYQTWSYGSIRWGENSLKHIVLYKNNELIAATQIRMVNIFSDKYGIAYISNGPMWKKKYRSHHLEYLYTILLALYIELQIKRKMFVRVIPNEIYDNEEKIQIILEKLNFHINYSVRNYETILIDLRMDLEKLLYNQKKRWRKNLNRANKFDIKLLYNNDKNTFSTFMKLYKEMKVRKGFHSPYDVNDFLEINNQLPDKLKFKTIIAYYNNIPASAIVWSEIGETAVILFSATGSIGMKIYSSYLIRWNMLKKAKTSGMKFLDQGGIDKEKNPNGYSYKRGFGGREISHVGVFDSQNKNFSCLTFRHYEKLKKIIYEKIFRSSV